MQCCRPLPLFLRHVVMMIVPATNRCWAGRRGTAPALGCGELQSMWRAYYLPYYRCHTPNLAAPRSAPPLGPGPSRPRVTSKLKGLLLLLLLLPRPPLSHPPPLQFAGADRQ